jgi:transposase
MAQPIAPDYGQQFLFPPALEDWVPADHPARFLREFVEQLDLPALGFALPAAVEGRPPYHPSLLLKIWLYGYYHRIRSTRKLEVACREHLSLLWLTGLIQPDHNSLWRFWRDNQKALRHIFKQTVQLAVHTGAVGLALQALDGTKIQAACSGPKGWSQEYMEKLLAQLDAALDEIELTLVEENADLDQSGYRLPAGLAGRQALREEIKRGLAQLQADGRSHYHPVEPEARRMKVGDTNRYAYNAQAVADGKEGVIVACDANRQETDNGQLVPMVQQARENLGVAAPAAVTLADTGYGAGGDLQAAAEKHLPVLVPPAEGAPAKDNPYASQHFHYDPADHTVTCPQGHLLDHEGHTSKDGVRVERFRCHRRDCPVRARCTGDPKGRQIEIRPHRQEVQAMRRRLQDPDARALWEQRARIIEPRFGQIKQHDGFRRWTVWGLAGVKTQWTMVCATLNLRILYRHWQAGRGPEKENPLAVISLKMAIRESKPSGGIQNQLARWWQKLLSRQPSGVESSQPVSPLPSPPSNKITFETVSTARDFPYHSRPSHAGRAPADTSTLDCSWWG